VDEQYWHAPFHGPLAEAFPALQWAQRAWLAQLESLSAPDRKTHELIRMVCSVIARNPAGIRRHALLAREVGATWEELLGSIMLTVPSAGLVPALEAIPEARKAFEEAPAPEFADDDDGDEA
jgi:alkylhydroperoxidase/carboxymuconolactone decarboxylase family protein YurZ